MASTYMVPELRYIKEHTEDRSQEAPYFHVKRSFWHFAKDRIHPRDWVESLVYIDMASIYSLDIID